MSKAKALPKNLKQLLLKAMVVAETSPEGAKYLDKKFKNLISNAHMENEYKDIIQKVEDFAKYTIFKLESSTNPWIGQVRPSSDFKNMQAQIAADEVQRFNAIHEGTEPHVTFDYAISDQSQFLRGYSSNGETLDAKSADSMDKLFNAYLAENYIVSEGSTFYEATDQGKIKHDAQGKPIIANSEKLTNLINDPDKGFAKYMGSKGINVISQKQQYPSVEKVEQAKAAVTAAIAEAPDAAFSEEAPAPSDTQSTMRAGG